MLQATRQLRDNEKGAAAVEMAFVLPLFLLFVIGIVEFGRVYWTLNSMQLAIDEAGRFAMLNTTSSDSQIISIAQANLYGLDSSLFTVTSNSQTTGGVIYKVITASYTFSFVAPDVLPFGNIVLSRSTSVPLMP
jgi:Flp pilus assembly protein TadG